MKMVLLTVSVCAVLSFTTVDGTLPPTDDMEYIIYEN